MRRLPDIRRVPALLAASALAGLLAWPAAQAAGKVDVSYVAPEKFTDIGFGSVEREHTLSELTGIFNALASFLPDDQTLRIEVLDVDLAGDVFPRSTREVRVLRGTVDWPQVTLRYTLLAGGSTLKSGQERVRDMSYMFSRRGLTNVGSNLPYEKRMLEYWFREQFMPAQ
jgi:hypothetical protein